MLTGVSAEELEREARLEGASGFLRKNLGIDVIIRAIGEVLQVQREHKDDEILVVDDDPAISSLIRDFLIS